MSLIWQDALNFDGKTFEPARDGQRLTTLFHKVFALMSDGRFRTLQEIQALTGGSEASVSARLRDFRKPRFGGHDVERRAVGNGLFTYRLKVGQ
jgi:hypothetical protein